MPFEDAFGCSKKNNAMKDAWGHLYPNPGKYPGYIIIGVGDSGASIVLSSHFKSLDASPQRFHVQNSILDLIDINIEPGVYKYECTMWIFKGCNDLYLSGMAGKLIKLKQSKLLSF